MQGRAVHFYKIIEENSLRNGELRIPRSFVSEHWEGMSNPVFLLLPNGAKWEVTWNKHGVDVWLSNNWKKFAEFYSLDQNHLLVFSYERKSQFRVVIFDQRALEIGYPLFQASSDSEKSDQSGNPLENFGGFSTRKSKRPKSPIPFSHSPKKMKTNPKEEPNCYPSHDVDTTQSQRTKLEMKRFYGDYENAKPKNRGRKRTIYVPSGSALERAKAFRTKNPSFIREMCPTYIQKQLAIPGGFITARHQKENDSATLWVSEERTWDVKFKVTPCNGQIRLYSGWKNFVEDNNLKVGDVCVFEQTKSESVSFRVVIFRAREDSSPPRSQAYGDALQNDFAERDCGGIAKKCSRTTNVFDDSEFPRNNSTVSENHFTFSLNHTKLKNANIPMEFIRKYVIDEVKDVMLRVGERSWPVKVDYYPEYRYAVFAKGWSAFVRDCNLKAGDVCLFELVDKEKFVLQVTISVPIN